LIGSFYATKNDPIVIDEEMNMVHSLNADFLIAIAALTETADPIAAVSLPIVAIVGFLAAVGLGSIAWYNSKRPAGWEDKKRPDIVPKIDTSSSNPEP
jgi:hypothetical protein